MGVVIETSSELRQREKTRIVELLDISAFSSKEFDITYAGSGELVRIVFIRKPEYQFVVIQKTVSTVTVGNVESQFITQEIPGKSQTKEVTRYTSLGECISLVKDWANRIQAEFIDDNPAYKQFKDKLEGFRQEVYQRIEEHIDDSDAHFSEEEKEKWRKAFDSLNEKIEKLQEQQEITEQELAELKSSIDLAKINIDLFPKKVSLPMFWNKVLATIGFLGSKRGQEAIESVKQLLPGGNGD